MIGKRNGNWSQKGTQKYFGLSVGLTSENLNLAKHYDELKQFPTRVSAIQFYLGKHK